MAATTRARPQSRGVVCAGAGRRTGTAVVEATVPVSQAGERGTVSGRLFSGLCTGLRQVRDQQWMAGPGASPKMDALRNFTGASMTFQNFIEIPGGSCVDF